MPWFVPGALAAALILSALGAVIVCVLIALYGFTGPDDEPPLTTARRLMYTRIGHALATTCFAATAILIGMVLVRSARPAPAPLAQDARVPELDARIGRQASRMTQIEAGARDANAGVTRAETRLRELEQSLQRLADEGRRTEHRVGRLETETRTALAERAAAARKAAVVARTPAPPPAPPVERVAPAPQANEPVAPAPPRAVAERVIPPSPSPEQVVSASPRPTPERVVAPPATTPSPSAGSADATLPASSSSKDHEPVTTVSASSSASSMPDGLRAKLRSDWTAIQKGFESSRDDLRRAFDGTMRKLRDLGQ